MSHTQVTPIDVEGSGVTPPAHTGTANPDPFMGSPASNPASGQTFTAEQIEKARREEREKVQRTLARQKETADQMKAELEQLRAKQAEADKKAEAEARKESKRQKAESEKDLSAKELLARREAEWEQQIAAIRHEQEQTKALMALERQHMQIATYTAGRVAEELAAQRIAPQFKEYITGTTPEEVETAIEKAREKSAEIAAEIREIAAGTQRYSGVSTNFGPANIGNLGPGAEPEIDATKLSYAEFVKNRDRLITQHKDQGIFN